MASKTPTPPRVPRWLVRLSEIGWRFLAVAAAFAVAGFVVVRLRVVVLPLIGGLLLATLLAAPAAWLKHKGWPPLLAAWAVFLSFLLLLAGILTVVVPVVAGELDDLGDSITEGVVEVERWLEAGPLGLSEEDLGRIREQAGQQLEENMGRIVGGLVAGAAMALELLVLAALSLVVLFFFLKDGDRIAGWLLDRAPDDRRELLSALGRRGWWTLQRYLGGSAIVGLVDAALIGVGLLVIGVPLIVPLMVLFFFGAFFPFVGAIVVGAITVLVALVAEGPATALIALVIVTAVQQLNGNVLEPVVLGRAVRLHPVVILLGITGGGVIGGIVGAFLAVPAAGVAAAVGNELRVRSEG